jgi:hypothetical protein
LPTSVHFLSLVTLLLGKFFSWDSLNLLGGLLSILGNEDTGLATLARAIDAACLFNRWGGGALLWLHQWPVALCLVVAQCKEAANDSDPVYVIGDNRAVSSGVLPSENGVEDTPSTTTVQLRVTKLFLC